MKLILLLLLFVSQIGLAQENPKIGDIRLRISKAITLNTDKELLGKTPKGYVYLFSVTLSFDDAGKIDTVYFPQKIDERINKVMKLSSALVKRIKDQNSVYKIYSSKFVFIPVFYHNMDDDIIDYRSGFLDSFEKMLPNVNLPTKQWVILKPLIEQFGPPRK